MKRISLFSISMLLLVTLFSCSKENENAAVTSVNWTVDGTNYSANSVSRSTTGSMSQLVVYADNTIQVFFSAIPTASGSFKVVDETKVYSNTLASNEIAVGFYVGSTDSYFSTGTDNVSATVTVGTNGKLKVVIPSIVVQHVNGSGPVGETTGSGTITE